MSELHRSTPPRRPVTRRTVLRGMAGLGAVAATGGLVAACGGSAASAAPSIGPAPTPAGTMPPDATAVPSAEPTPVPQPEDELYVYNWADYIGEDTIAEFEDQFGVKVTYDFFDSVETQTAKIATGNSGYDVTFPTSSYLKGFIERNLILPLDLALIPNVVNLAPEWQDPAYDPGNAHSMPYMWWTTGIRLRHGEDPGDADLVGRPLGRAMGRQDGHARRRARDVRGGPHPSRLQRQHDQRRRAGRGAGPAREAEAAAAHLHDRRHRGAVLGQRVGVACLGRGRVPGPGGARERRVLHPRGGWDQGFRHHGPARRRQAPGRGPRLHQLHAGRRGLRRPTRTTSATWDPTRRPSSTSIRRSWRIRRSTPTQAAVAKLQEILDLGADEQKYTDRWTKLRSGG